METLAGHNGGTWCGGVMMVRHWGIMNTKETYKPLSFSPPNPQYRHFTPLSAS